MVSAVEKYYVYGHFRNDTKQLFYVGKGCDNRARSKKNRNKHWHNIVNKVGYFIQFYIKDVDEETAFSLEKAIIADLSPECNYTAGGEGGNAFFKKTPEEIANIVSRRKIDPSKCASYGFKGKKHTTERNAKLSARFKGKTFHSIPQVQLDNLISAAKRKSIKIKCVDTGATYESIRDASRQTGLSKSWIIWNLKRNKKFVKI